MTELALLTASAFWLGLLTSVSPCPLATNVAAVSYVGRRLDQPRRVLLGGVLYTAGRVLTYTVIGSLLVSSLLSAPELSLALQRSMNRALGPILVLVAMVLLDLLPLPGLRGGGLAARFQGRADRLGVWGAFLLGVVFALSFCPISAVLFFGSLIPVALEARSGVLLPAAYGVGTGLPVLLFALLLAFGARSLGRVFGRVQAFERWARRGTGVVFLLVGVYYTLAYVFRVLPS